MISNSSVRYQVERRTTGYSKGRKSYRNKAADFVARFKMKFGITPSTNVPIAEPTSTAVIPGEGASAGAVASPGSSKYITTMMRR